MAFHQKFLSSPEFRGRNTPSVEQDIASRYIALVAERIGLKPLLPGGSYYQEVPVEVTTLVPGESGLRLVTAGREQTFRFPEDATAGRSFEPGKASGEIVFLGYGLSAPELGWDDTAGVDLKGQVAVILDATLPDGHPLKPAENRRLLAGRAGALRERGAAAVVTIITAEREARLAEKGLSFDLPERLKFPDVVTGSGTGALPGTAPQRPGGPFLQVEVRHAAAAAILGWPPEELAAMSETLRSGKPVAARKLPGRQLELDDRRRDPAGQVLQRRGRSRRRGPGAQSRSTSPSARTTITIPSAKAGSSPARTTTSPAPSGCSRSPRP